VGGGGVQLRTLEDEGVTRLVRGFLDCFLNLLPLAMDAWSAGWTYEGKVGNDPLPLDATAGS